MLTMYQLKAEKGILDSYLSTPETHFFLQD